MKRMKRFDPMASCFLRTGRYDKKADTLGLWWSGSGLTMRIACTRLEIEAESTARGHAQWLGVLIDGAPVTRLPLRRGIGRYAVLAGMDAGTWHEVTVLRDTQPSYDEDGPVRLLAVYSDGTIERPAEKELMIEFIGDSLTVGEGTVGPQSAMEWTMPFISHMPAFPTLVAEALGAQRRVVALGGWGAYKSWDGNHDSRIGAIYEKLCAVTPGGDVPYDFDERSADAVVINLGTNDGSALKSVPPAERPGEEAAFIRDAAALLKLVRRHQPRAQIIWAYGLCGTDMANCVRRAVEQVRAEGDENVSFLPLPDAAGDVGSRMHPSRRAHEKAAEALIRAIQSKPKA